VKFQRDTTTEQRRATQLQRKVNKQQLGTRPGGRRDTRSIRTITDKYHKNEAFALV